MGAFVDELMDGEIIAAVKDDTALRRACDSQARVIFLLGGDIMGLGDQVSFIRARGKRAFVHMDLCEGLGRDSAAVDFCAQVIRPDGIISTRAPLIKRANECGLITIQRMFLMDSQSLTNGVRLIKNSSCDMVEVLPGLIPKAISFIRAELNRPIIAGGMITTYREASLAINAGAVAVSTSCAELWKKNIKNAND